MEITDFSFKLILIFIPGLLSLFVIESLASLKEIKTFKYIIYSLLLGFFNYLFYFIFGSIWAKITKRSFCFEFINNLISAESIPNLEEIFIVSIISVIIGHLVAFIIYKNFHYRFARFLGVTNKAGSLNIWNWLMDSNKDQVKWITVRDIANDLIFEGWVEAYSDTTSDELFLRDVKVYKNSTGVFLYPMPGVYLHKKWENFIIEFPQLTYQPKKEKKHDENKKWHNKYIR